MGLLLTLSWLVTIVPFKVLFFWLKEYSSILNCRPAKKEKLPYDLLPLKSDCFGTLKERKKEREGSNGLVVGVKHDIPLVTKALKKENML